MLRLDLTDVNNLRAVENVKVESAVTFVCKKATHATEVRKFKTNARNFLVHLVKKLKERSPFRYKFTLYISSLLPTQIAAKNYDFLTDLFSYVCILLNAIGCQVCVPILLKPLINLSLKAMTLRKE